MDHILINGESLTDFVFQSWEYLLEVLFFGLLLFIFAVSFFWEFAKLSWEFLSWSDGFNASRNSSFVWLRGCLRLIGWRDINQIGEISTVTYNVVSYLFNWRLEELIKLGSILSHILKDLLWTKPLLFLVLHFDVCFYARVHPLRLLKLLWILEWVNVNLIKPIVGIFLVDDFASVL